MTKRISTLIIAGVAVAFIVLGGAILWRAIDEDRGDLESTASNAPESAGIRRAADDQVTSAPTKNGFPPRLDEGATSRAAPAPHSTSETRAVGEAEFLFEVVDVDGRAVENATVSVIEVIPEVEREGVPDVVGRTDASGKLAWFSPRVRLAVFGAIDETRRRSGRTGEVRAGQTSRIVLEPSFGLDVVVMTKTKEPIAASVTLSPSPYDSDVPGVSAETSSNGRAEFRGLPAGRFELTAHAVGYRSKDIVDVVCDPESTTVVEVILDPLSERRTRIVTDPAGDIPETIELRPTRRRYGPPRRLTPDAAGLFSLPVLPDGTIAEIFGPKRERAVVGFAQGIVQPTILEAGVPTVKLAAGATVVGRLEGRPDVAGSLRARLIERPNPIPGHFSTFAHQALVDTDGGFRFDGLAPNAGFVVEVALPGGFTHVPTAGKTSGPGSTIEVQIAVVPQSELVVRVVDTSSRPIPGALVDYGRYSFVRVADEFLPVGDFGHREFKSSDAEGEVVIGGPPRSNVAVEVRAAGFFSHKNMWYAIPPGGRQTTTIKLAPVLRCRGKVVDAADLPAVGATVFVERDSGNGTEILSQGTTNGTGQFDLAAPDDGQKIRIRARRQGVVVTREFETVPSDDVTLKFP